MVYKLFLMVLVLFLVGVDAERTLSHRKLQQNILIRPAVPAPTCTTIKDASPQMPVGSLCVSQLVSKTSTEIVCDRYDPACVKATTTDTLLSPKGDALSNPTEFQASADAACRTLGYTAAGSGSVHMTGDNDLVKKTCWNGKSWASDNYWASLVCCK